LFYSFLFSREVSSRIEHKAIGSEYFPMDLVKDIFVNGQYHAHSLHKFFIVPILFFLIQKIKYFKQMKSLFLMFSFIVLTSFFYGALDYEPITQINNSINQILPVSFKRFHFLHPLFWYILIGASFNFFWKRKLIAKLFMLIIVCFHTKLLFINSEYFYNRWEVKYKDFYDESKFQKIHEFIACNFSIIR
jgi:hypothetical protein